MDSPVTVIMKCGQVTPIGLEVVRVFDPDYCIVATTVFLVLYGGDTYGTTQFKTYDECLAFLNAQCVCCLVDCTFTIDCCDVTINGCTLFVETNESQCQLFINGCRATINGQNLVLFSNN